MTNIIDHYVDQYTADSVRNANDAPEWLTAQKQSAIAQFRKGGFPTQRDEDWRYTSLKSVISKLFEVKVDQAVAKVDVARFAIDAMDAYRLVFIDGMHAEEYSSLPQGLDGFTVNALGSMSAAEFDTAPATMTGDVALPHGFSALNVAFSRDGYVIRIADEVVLDKPLEIMFIAATDNVASQPRNVIELGRFSRAQIIQRHVSVEGITALDNSTCAVSLDEGARLDYYLVESLGNTVTQVNTIDAALAGNSNFGCRTLTLGGGLIRNNLKINLNGSGAHCDMLGLYNISGKQHVDNHTSVVHAAPHCTSNELYKGVLDKRSRAVFHGRIKVEQDAQKTDAKQANNNLLLSAHAEIDTKPQLEIYADDVKCAHGATVGQLDETSLFYLRSRGIDEESARSLLTFAFVNDVMEQVEIGPLRESISAELATRLIADSEDFSG